MSTQGTNWLSQRSASAQMIASGSAALPLSWSPGDQCSNRQRSALRSILDYVMQVTGVTPKQAHSVLLLGYVQSLILLNARYFCCPIG